ARGVARTPVPRHAPAAGRASDVDAQAGSARGLIARAGLGHALREFLGRIISLGEKLRTHGIHRDVDLGGPHARSRDRAAHEPRESHAQHAQLRRAARGDRGRGSALALSERTTALAWVFTSPATRSFLAAAAPSPQERWVVCRAPGVSRSPSVARWQARACTRADRAAAPARTD